MSLEFVGQSLALSQAGIDAVTGTLGVGAAELWTVMTVETSGCGFLPDRRPPILFERHIFHRLTAGRFDDGSISDPEPGGYGPLGAAQYQRLSRAIALDRDAALQSASWGLGQIMGQNCAMAGFPEVSQMIAAMSLSEDAQLTAVGAFLKASKLDKPLESHDWAGFAKGYNGPSFVKNRYDEKLAAAYQKLSSGSLPDLNVRTAQLYLSFCGFDPGPVDGLMGLRTRQSIAAFQNSKGMPTTGTVDESVLAALRPAAC
jgi:N-acetylmuramidase/Putative peptidoglycan binding domain